MPACVRAYGRPVGNRLEHLQECAGHNCTETTDITTPIRTEPRENTNSREPGTLACQQIVVTRLSYFVLAPRNNKMKCEKDAQRRLGMCIHYIRLTPVGSII